MVIEILVLAEDDRVINFHSFEQHRVGVLDCSGSHHHDAGIMRVESLHALRMKRPGARSATAGKSHNDGARHARPPKHRRRVLENLREAAGGKIRELHFDNRAHPFERCANGEPDLRILGNRRINHASGKLLRQSLCRFECAAEVRDVLPVDENAFVFREQFTLRCTDRLKVGNRPGLSSSGGLILEHGRS